MLDKLVGGSPALRRIRAAIPRLASTSVPVLIVGDPGVGKSLVASRIHARSPLRSTQLLVINFAVLSQRDQRVALLGGGPSELTTTRKSLLEFPTTVVIKDIDRAPPYLQEQLAEAIKSKRIRRPGMTGVYPVTARLVFTVTAGLRELREHGRISPSLSQLIESFTTVFIPPLRKRKRDIPPIAEHFLHVFYDKLHSLVNGHVNHVKGLDNRGKIESDLADLLMNQSWPGNVLQLKAFIHSLITPNYDYALLQAEKIEVSKMLLMLDEGREFSLRDSMSIIEDGIIQRAMDRFEGQQKTAQILGLTGRTIRRRKIQ